MDARGRVENRCRWALKWNPLQRAGYWSWAARPFQIGLERRDFFFFWHVHIFSGGSIRICFVNLCRTTKKEGITTGGPNFQWFFMIFYGQRCGKRLKRDQRCGKRPVFSAFLALLGGADSVFHGFFSDIHKENARNFHEIILFLTRRDVSRSSERKRKRSQERETWESHPGKVWKMLAKLSKMPALGGQSF